MAFHISGKIGVPVGIVMLIIGAIILVSAIGHFEEAEEIAALNLAKFRQTQANLQESEGRADLNESALAKFKAKGRSASMGPMVG